MDLKSFSCETIASLYLVNCVIYWLFNVVFSHFTQKNSPDKSHLLEVFRQNIKIFFHLNIDILFKTLIYPSVYYLKMIENIREWKVKRREKLQNSKKEKFKRNQKVWSKTNFKLNLE